MGSELVNESGKTLDEIVEAVNTATEVVSEIAAASQEQSSGIDQVNKAVVQMDDLTQHNAALVEQVAAAGRSMEDQAETLREAVGFFKLRIGEQQAKVRTAAMHKTEAAAHPERRAHERPFQGKPAPQPAPQAKSEQPQPAAVVKKTGTDGHGEWQQF